MTRLRATSWLAMVCVLPTLVVPISEWHHHHAGRSYLSEHASTLEGPGSSCCHHHDAAEPACPTASSAAERHHASHGAVIGVVTTPVGECQLCLLAATLTALATASADQPIVVDVEPFFGLAPTTVSILREPPSLARGPPICC